MATSDRTKQMMAKNDAINEAYGRRKTRIEGALYCFIAALMGAGYLYQVLVMEKAGLGSTIPSWVSLVIAVILGFGGIMHLSRKS